MAEKVLAATQIGSKKIEVRQYLTPEISADDALLKMEIAGICGSDIGGYAQYPGEPQITGHENVGFIAKIGGDAARRWGVKEGDRVVVEQYLPCGNCRWCRIGEYRLCDQTDKLPGRTILRYGNTPVSVSPSLWGGFSEYDRAQSSCARARERGGPFRLLSQWDAVGLSAGRRGSWQNCRHSGAWANGFVERGGVERGGRRLHHRERPR